MVKIQIRLPLNISRGFTELLREHLASFPGADQGEIEIEDCHGCGRTEKQSLRHGDIVIGFIPELVRQRDDYLLEHLISVPGRFPIDKALQNSGFVDPLGCFHTFAVVPFVILYNPDYTDASEVPCTWKELLTPRWKGRIMMPGPEHIAPQVIRAVLKYENPSQVQALTENFICRGMPPNVIEAVRNGEFSLGITNITFGKISGNHNIKMIWPEDGILCMPQMIAWKKGLDNKLLKIGDFIFSAPIQNFLAQQSFVPAAIAGTMPDNYDARSTAVLKWSGWDDFRTALKNSEM